MKVHVAAPPHAAATQTAYYDQAQSSPVLQTTEVSGVDVMKLHYNLMGIL